MNEWKIILITMILQGLAVLISLAKLSNVITKDRQKHNLKHESEHTNFRNFIEITNTRIKKLEENQRDIQKELYNYTSSLKDFFNNGLTSMQNKINEIYQILLKL